jgi:hypothetical protein
MGAIQDVLRACEDVSNDFAYAAGQSVLKLSQGATINLGHSAELVRCAASDPVALVVEDGAVTLCDFSSGRRLDMPMRGARLTSASPHPWRPLMALVDARTGGLRIQTYGGDVLFEDGPPLAQDAPRSAPPEFCDCFFDDRGAYLWCAASVSGRHIEVQLRETHGWSIVASFLVEDCRGGSRPLFFRTSKPDVLALWLPGGTGGSSFTYWLRLERDAVTCAGEPALDGALPPAFSPGSHEFLAVDWQGGVLRFAYPDVYLTGACPLLPGEGRALDYCPPCYLDERLVLVMSEHQRMFLLDVFAMHVVRELVIEGHEPAPAEWRDPRRMGDRTLRTDIASFSRVGDFIVFNHSYGAGSGPSGERSNLLCFPVSAI